MDTTVFVVILMIVLLVLLLLWYIHTKLINTHAYYWINKWNTYITDIRDKQNAVYDAGLPPSMQYANTAKLPAASKLDSLIVTNHDAILAEVLALIAKGYHGYPMAKIDNVQGSRFHDQSGWKPIWVKFIDSWAGTSKHLPTLTKIVKQMGSDVLLLHVSVFWPPVELDTHRGISKGVYRYHYGLDIPDGNTGMVVDNVPFKWSTRQGVIWDDTLPHKSWNLTDKPRLVIFADLPRTLGRLDWCNRKIHTLIQHTKHVKEIQTALAKEGIHID